MDSKGILSFLKTQQNQITYLYENIVRIETPSSAKTALEELAAHLDTYLNAMGLNVVKHCYENAGPSIVASTKATALPPILLCSHLDTVHPVGAFGKDAFIRDKDNPDKVYGPGVYDTKGGVVIAIFVLKALLHFGYTKRQIKLVLVSDEEVAHNLSQGASAKLIEDEASGACCCFNCDSGRLNDRIVLQRNGGGIFKLKVHGKAAHAGNAPWEGANAILAASKMIAAIAELNDYNDAYFGAGVIKGGTKSNIVPDYCEVTNDIRFKTNAAYNDALAKIRTIADSNPDSRIHAEVEATGLFRAMEKVPKTDALLDHFADACQELGYNRPTGVFAGGCSDAAFVTYMGVPTLCGTGIVGDNGHTLEEYAFESSIIEQAAKVILTILTLPDDF
ncbi:M20/M25/M40 family metallo-hydrolase [Phascolarctobacterium sp.]|uniref:M20/M25/M40 family metallo-hydrolase n=1 Tax=Phascolarctobacterium sp. TaxID=2049039 RepID=UPI00386B904F